MAFEATPMWPGSPGLANTRCSELMKTGLWNESVCTAMPPLASSAKIISNSPTCSRNKFSHGCVLIAILAAAW